MIVKLIYASEMRVIQTFLLMKKFFYGVSPCPTHGPYDVCYATSPMLIIFPIMKTRKTKKVM